LRRLTLAILSVTILAVACGGTKSSRFYLLSSLPAPGEPAEPGRQIALDITYFPDYLQRPQIVAHAGDNELVLEEYDRWGEPLEMGFTRTLIVDLASLRPADAVREADRVGGDLPVVLVTIWVTRFDINGDETTTLQAAWEIDAGSGEARRGSTLAHKPVVPKKKSYAGQVAALSGLVEVLARDISAAIDDLPRD